MNINQIKSLLLFSLQKLDIQKIILFGSYAEGKETRESDIDILVVTNDDYIPASFEEKMKVKVKVARELEKIREQNSLDLIVHTKAMHKEFLLLDSMFKKEILTKGIILYEKND